MELLTSSVARPDAGTQRARTESALGSGSFTSMVLLPLLLLHVQTAGSEQQPLPPISFTYGGESLAAGLKRAGGFSRSSSAPFACGLDLCLTHTLAHRDGFQATIAETRFLGLGGTISEYSLRFRHAGPPGRDSAVLCNVSGFASSVPTDARATVTLHRFRGSGEQNLTTGAPIDLPTDFEAIDEVIGTASTTRFAPTGGRSSQSALPLANLHTGSGGVVVSVGWSGSWHASVSRTATATQLDIAHRTGGGIGGGGLVDGTPSFCSFLRPGESVELMTTAVGYYDGTTTPASLLGESRLLQPPLETDESARIASCRA
eukprot:COSAG03_NODE_2193_length_3022_cov_1.418064_4_plen_317_part_00